MVLLSRPQRSTRIIDFHNASHSRGGWSYGQTADSDIDVGIQFAYHGWGISGSTHVGIAAGSEVGGSTSNDMDRYARTYFEYPLVQYRAADPAQGGRSGDWCTDGTHQIGENIQYAYSWTGGAGSDSGTTGTSCSGHTSYMSPLPGGYYDSVTRSRATRNSWVLTAAGGAHLGGTSGYSTNVTMHWSGDQGTGGIWLCGKYGYANQSPGVVYTQNR